MKKPSIRFAVDSDSEAIREILIGCDQIPYGLDWSKIYPSWLVAERKGEITGCIQVLIGFPLSHIGFWAVSPFHQNRGIGIYLWLAAQNHISNCGSDGFTGLTSNPEVLKHMGKFGVVSFGDPVRCLFKRVMQIEKGYSNGTEPHHINQQG